MLKFTSFDRSTDTITTIDRQGVLGSCDIESFIRSGKVAELSWSDKARLYPYLNGRKDIIADRGVGGSHCFCLTGEQPLLVYLWGLYMATLIICPLLFGFHFGWWSVDFTLASGLFPLSFSFLNPVSELYGQRNARRLLNSTMVVLMALAVLGWLLQTLVLLLPVFDHSGTQAFGGEMAHYPKWFAVLALALWITDSINIWFFQQFRRWMNQQWFEFRAFLSNSLVQLVFTPMCAFFLHGAFWQNPELNQQVWGIAGLKVVLVIIYLPLSSLVVRKAGQWMNRIC